MRALFWFLLLAAAAVVVALGTRITTGYVLLVAPPYRIELSLNLLILLLIAGFALGYVLVRVVKRTLGMPREVRALRRRRQQERVRAKHDAAIVALLEGRYGKARQYAQEALAIPQSTGLAALIAARAAMETRDFDTASSLLARPDAQVTSLAVPRLMLEAEMRLERGAPVDALSVLQSLKKEAGLHTAALRLELRALRGAGRYADIPPLVDQLVKRGVYGQAEGEIVRAAAIADELESLVNDATRLRMCWNRLSEADQRMPRIARAGARAFLALGGDREAAEIIAKSLERTWEPDLLSLYAECRTSDPTRELEQAEHWLTAHSGDAALLYALGVLCQRAQLWGKAQTYLEASLALDDSYRTRIALGELCARVGQETDANTHLAAALKLAVAELRRRDTRHGSSG